MFSEHLSHMNGDKNMLASVQLRIMCLLLLAFTFGPLMHTAPSTAYGLTLRTKSPDLLENEYCNFKTV